MKKLTRVARHALLYMLIGLGVAAGLAGAVSLSSQGAQGARVQRLTAALQMQNLPNFTVDQQAAIARTRQGILHPAWSTLSPAEKFDRVARFAEQLFAATPTATLPTPASFLGNLTALAFAHTGANAFSLRRQGDCSLSLLQDSYAYGSTGMSALTLSAATSSVPHYEQTLHANAGLATPVDAFAGGCSDATAGAGSQRWVALGSTSTGLPRFAGVGYYPTGGNNALWYGTENPAGTMSASFQTDTSLPGLGALATGDLNGDGFVDVVGIDQLHGQIAVWLANADGSLNTPVLYALPGTLTEGAVIADVNGDGKADVIAASSNQGGSEQLSVLIGNGDGRSTQRARARCRRPAAALPRFTSVRSLPPTCGTRVIRIWSDRTAPSCSTTAPAISPRPPRPPSRRSRPARASAPISSPPISTRTASWTWQWIPDR